MAQPMPKEEARPASGRQNPDAPWRTPELRARAAELERKLGRPLRLEIDGPLTDEESEEVLIARMMDDEELIPAEKLLEDFKRLLPDKKAE